MSEDCINLEPHAPASSRIGLEKVYSSNESPTSDTPSGDDAARFLSALAPSGTVTFQVLPELKKHGRARGPNTIVHQRKLEALRSFNTAGSGVFVMVNEGDGRGRRESNVTNVRAVFVDLDGAPLDPVLAAPIGPSITVESSPGRFHAYWLVRNMPLKDFRKAQQALAAKFNGDKSVCDLPRLMRVPGFLHQKSVPFRSRLLSCDSSAIWDWQHLAKELNLPKSLRLAETILEGERNTTLFNLAAASAKTGTSLNACIDDLIGINAERCVPPLSLDEVIGLAERAYRNPSKGYLKTPLTLFSDQRFLALKPGPKLLLLLIYQRICNKPNDSEISLLWKDFKQHFPRQNTFKDYRAVLVASGLVRLTKKAKKKPKDGKPDYNLYQLVVVDGI